MSRPFRWTCAFALLLVAGLACSTKGSAANEKTYVCSMCGKEKSAPADAPAPSC